MKILVLTVGGSHQPIVKSLEQKEPDLAVFLCSNDMPNGPKGSYVQVIGEGMVNRSKPGEPPDLPNIVTLARMPQGAWMDPIKIDDIDDLGACYRTASELLDRLHAENPGAAIWVDYTGGTKSMTAGLALAGVDDPLCNFCIVTGHRADLIKTKDGTEVAHPLEVADIRIRKRLREVDDLLGKHNYSGALMTLEAIAAQHGVRTSVDVQGGIVVCRAFRAWDRFDHGGALELLQTRRKKWISRCVFLGNLINDKGHGFERVQDLLLNAERREVNQRYDDAVGRLYRAIELTAQIWLRKRYGIDSAAVELNSVPDSYRPSLPAANDNGAVQLGLMAAWDLIGAFPDDPVGSVFMGHRSKLLNVLEVRNQSILAHGDKPIAKSEFKRVRDVATPLVDATCKAAALALGKKFIAAEQLPQSLDLGPQAGMRH